MSPLTRKEYTDPAEKKRDFWIGVGLWVGLNIALTLCSWGGSLALAGGLSADSSNSDGSLSAIFSVLALLWNFLPFVINVGLIIYFGITRSQIALGMLAAFAAVMVLVICLGLIFMAACFVMLGQSG